MKDLSSRLKFVLRHLADVEAIIERQREHFANMEAQGRLTEEATEMLDTYLSSLGILQDQAKRPRDDLDSFQR